MPIRWGIVGCGNVCEVKSGPGFQKAEGSRLVAVMRRDAAKAEDFARRHGVPRWYGDADALIRDPEVDAVYVATPVGTHGAYALKVCAAGKPCYVEKPMARSHEECRRMVEAFREAGLPLFVAYYRRGLPRFLKAKELVEAGRLGRLTGVAYRYAEPRHRHVKPDALEWRLVASESGGGIFMDLGSHALDILDFLVGPLEDASGRAANLASPYDVEDAVAMQFRTADGALGTASWNFASAARSDRIEISGTDGRVSLSVFEAEPVRLETAEGVEEFDLPNPPHVQQPLIQTIVDELRGRGTCPSTGQSAARTARVMDTVLAGYYGSRTGEFWARPETWPGRRRRG
jgi:predicted dehydrogenase